MDLSEILFLGGFIVFISAILLLDMFVIDKKAHVGHPSDPVEPSM